MGQKLSSFSQGLEALCGRLKTDTPEAAIKGACSSLLNACGIKQPPVALKPVLKALDVSFQWSKAHWRKGNGAASLQQVHGKLAIFLHETNFRYNWRRTRFQIAHELVHALIIRLLDDSSLILSIEETPEAYIALEKLCDIGAAELLLPARMLRSELRDKGLRPNDLYNLYDQFLVSREVLIRRIASLTPTATVIRWRQYSRHEDESNCWRVLSCHPGYTNSSARPWLPKGATTKHLASDILTTVEVEKRTRCFSGFQIKLDDNRYWECAGVATFFGNRVQEQLQPKFEGFTIKDERNSKFQNDILLFLEKNETTLMKKLIERSQEN